MTTTIVFGSTTDGYVSSTNATYATARAGSGLVANTAATSALTGQTTGYTHHQTFIAFTYTAVTGVVVTSAAVRLHVTTVGSPGTTRALELRRFNWSGSGLTSADFRNSTDLASAALQAQISGVNAAAGKKVYGGSDELRTLIEGGTTPLELVVVTDRQRAGTVPTGDETMTLVSADTSGTTDDPCLIFTTVARSKLYGVLGAQGRLADGTSVYLETDGAATPTITLKHRDHGATVTTIGTALPMATGGSSWSAPTSLQGFALAVGGDDSIYVIGRQFGAENSLRTRTYRRDSGTWVTAGDQVFSLPSHDAAANQFAACVLASSGLESLVILAAHTNGTSGATAPADIAYVVLDTTTLKVNSGTFLRVSGVASSGLLFPVALGAGAFNGFANETGTMLDLVADPGTAGQAYAISAERAQVPGTNSPVAVARLTMNSGHNGFTEAGYMPIVAYLEKNATGKARVLPIGPYVVAAVTADAEPGYSLSVVVEQFPGSGSSSVNLGYIALGEQGIATLPDGPATGGSAAWDALYDPASGKVWVYYVNVSNPVQVLRTGVDMSTYSADGSAVVVYAAPAGSTVHTIRVPRNGHSGPYTLVQVAYADVSAVEQIALVQDSFNLPPLAPTLATRDGFDATTDAAFSWSFQDPNTGDEQSAYQLQIEDQSTGVVTVDTTKTASGVAMHVLLAGTLTNSETYRWRTKTWDGSDAEGAWSDWQTFSTAAGGTVTVTDPAADNQPGIATDEYLVQWSATGTTQTQYRVWLYRTYPVEFLVSDTGWVSSADTSHLVTGLITDLEQRVEVQVRNSVGVASNIGTRLITPSFGTPDAPEVTVTPVPDGGYMLIEVINPIPTGDRPDVAVNHVYRRAVGAVTWTKIGECEPNGSVRDYTVASRQPYEYMVRGITA